MSEGKGGRDGGRLDELWGAGGWRPEEEGMGELGRGDTKGVWVKGEVGEEDGPGEDVVDPRGGDRR